MLHAAAGEKALSTIGQGPRQQLWVRTRDSLPDGPLLHACALTYISDIRLVETANLLYQDVPAHRQMASLDHAVWFHRPFRVGKPHLRVLTGSGA